MPLFLRTGRNNRQNKKRGASARLWIVKNRPSGKLIIREEQSIILHILNTLTLNKSFPII